MKAAGIIDQMLVKFADIEDFEYNGVRFKTNIPWKAPKAYLHILFPPVPADLLNIRREQLQIPDVLADFYSDFNGVSLFAGVLEIYGIRPDHYLLNRSDWRCTLPFNLIDETIVVRKECDARGLFCFGSYSHDGSLICMDRAKGQVTAFEGHHLRMARFTWNTFEEFLVKELERLSAYFDERGLTHFSTESLFPSRLVN